MALDTLEHRNIAEVDWVSERLIGFVVGFAFAISEGAEIDRMLNG